MFTRLASSLVLVTMLTACSSTPDRYAFWRDDSPPQAAGEKPNLGNIPAAPDTQTAKAEMESMRQRLEIERQNAFRAVQGLPPLPMPGETVTAAPNNGVAMDELNPATAPMMNAQLPTPEVPPMMMAQPQTWQTGSVQYNYAPQQDYVYGNSNYQFKQQMARMPVPQMQSGNPSISIDMSALDGGTTMSLSPMALSGGRTIAYFGHGSSAVDRAARNQITELAKRLQNSNSSVVLVGHASQRTGLNDPIASQVVNLRMASKRAETVMKELSRHGVPAAKVKITALGDSQANSYPQGKSQEAADRRVDILFD